MLNISGGRYIISAGRRIGKSTACEMFAEKYGKDGYKVCIATKNPYQLYIHKRAEAMEPRHIMGKYFDYVLMDDASGFSELEFLSCISASENIIAISTPKAGSYFNDFYMDCDWHKFRFYKNPETGLIRYYTDQLYREEMLGKVE